MEDVSHLLQYRRFFGVLLSVLPGLEAAFGLSALTLFLVADALDGSWGLGIGLAALTFLLVLTIWIFVGQKIQEWAEDKSGMFLFGLCLPFLIIFFGAMTAIFMMPSSEHAAPAASHAAAMIAPVLAAFG